MVSKQPTESLDDVLELMNTEHQQISEIVGRINSAIASQDLPVIKRELMHLQLFEQSHFRHENEIMERYNYPDIVSHKDTHNTTIETLNSIIRSIIIENLHRISEDLGKYLAKSQRHILEDDNDLRDFLLEIKKDTG